MLVEFCAPSGSGKTTVVKAWMRAAERSGTAIRRARDLPFLARKMLVLQAQWHKSRPSPEGSLEHFCDTHCEADREANRGKLIKDLLQFAYWRGRQPRTPLLFDESVCHHFLRLCMRSSAPPAALVDTYLRLMPRPDVIVTLSVPPELSFARIWKRAPENLYFFRGKSRDEALRLLRAANEARDLLLAGAERMGIPVIRCDGQLAPEINVRRIDEAIRGRAFSPAPTYAAA